MADKRWQSEYAARLAQNVSRREKDRLKAAEPVPSLESARAPGGFAAYARGKSRQTEADRNALADLVNLMKRAKTTD